MNIKLNLPTNPFSGQIVTFEAPCDCANVTNGLSINGEIYTVCDATGNCITGADSGGAWSAGVQVSVTLDCAAKKAYILNSNNNASCGVFYAKYGETTIAELNAAFSAGKAIIVYYNEVGLGYLTAVIEGRYNFVINLLASCMLVYVDETGWGHFSVNLVTDNMFTYGTTDLTAGSSDLLTGNFYFVYE